MQGINMSLLAGGSHSRSKNSSQDNELATLGKSTERDKGKEKDGQTKEWTNLVTNKESEETGQQAQGESNEIVTEVESNQKLNLGQIYLLRID